MIQKVISMKDTYLTMCEESYMPVDMKEKMAVLIDDRIGALEDN